MKKSKAALFFFIFLFLMSWNYSQSRRSFAAGVQLPQPSVEVSGQMEYNIGDDMANHRAIEEIYIIDDNTQQRTRVHFGKKPARPFKTGDKVKLKGRVTRDGLVVDDPDSMNGSSSATLISSAPGITSLEQRKLVVILVNFTDMAAVCTRDQTEKYLFPVSGNLNTADFYTDASFVQQTFARDTNGDGVTDIFGPYTISALSTDACDQLKWAQQAESIATANGVNFSLYQHRLFVLPNTSSCSWWGWANIGCSGWCRAWVKNCSNPDIFAHELGHNLGMAHSSTDPNNDGTIDSEYGDYSDIMGYSGVGMRHPNSVHKVELGWYNNYPSRVKNVTASGSFSVAPLALHPDQIVSADQPQVLVIPKPNTPGSSYYVSYRLNDGVYDLLSTSWSGKAYVHSRTDSVQQSLLNKTMTDGDYFDDATNGVRVTFVSQIADPKTGSGTVNVDFRCVRGTSSVSVAPTQQYGAWGQAKAYTVTVQNKDTPACGNSTFNLQGTWASGFQASWTNSSLSVPAGGSQSAQVSLTAAAGIADGSYSQQVQAADSTGAHSTVSSPAFTFTVDNTPPSAPGNLSGSNNSRRGTNSLSWSAASDSGSGVGSYEIYQSMNGGSYSLMGTTSSLSYTISGIKSRTTYQYYVLAVDRVGLKSAPSTVLRITTR